MAEVFISYSRTDSDFVRALDDHLKGQGRDVWVDWEDIAPADDWQQDIYDNIDAAESFVFVVSAKSLGSQYCGKELTRAQEGGKRIIPIACDAADPAAAPASLSQLNWIWCRTEDERSVAFEKLTTALETDLAWAKAHTRLLVRAVEWDARGDGSLLLRGTDLKEAEQNLAANAGKQPAPTELQQRYLLASRRAATRRQRIMLGSAGVALAVAIALGIVALLQRNTANARARLAQSQAMVAKATEGLSIDPRKALGAAVRAVEISRNSQSETALREALLANPIAYAIPAGAKSATPSSSSAGTEMLSFVDAGRLLAGLTPDGTLHLWRAADGRPISPFRHGIGAAAFGPHAGLLSTNGTVVWFDRFGRTGHVARRLPRGEHVAALGFAGAQPLALVVRGPSATVLSVATGTRVPLRTSHFAASEAHFSDTGNRVLTQDQESADSTFAKVWDTRTGRLVASVPGGPDPTISPNGRFVATALDGLWSVTPRRQLSSLGEPQRVTFSPDSRLVIAIGQDGSARFYRTRTGELVDRLPSFGSLDPFGTSAGVNVYSAFSPAVAVDPHFVAVADSDGLVRVWGRGTDRVVAAVQAGYANALAFGPGGLLAAMTWNGDVLVSRLPSIPVFSAGLNLGQGAFAPAFSEDRTRFVMPAQGGVLVGGVDDSSPELLPMPNTSPDEGTLGSWAISGDGTTVAASADIPTGFIDPKYRSWTSVWRVGDSTPLLRLPRAGSRIMLDEHGSVIAFAGKAWSTETGARIHALDGIRQLSSDGHVALVRRGATGEIVHVGTSQAATPLERMPPRGSNARLEAIFGPGDGRLLLLQGTSLGLWDLMSGKRLAQLGRPGEDVHRVSFGGGGALVLVLFEDRAATFDAATGKQLLSLPGSFAAISPDGRYAVRIPDQDTQPGLAKIADLAAGLVTPVQTDAALRLATASFGPSATALLLTDVDGVVHRVLCTICAPEGALVARARSDLAHLPPLRRPPAAMSG